MATDRFNNLLKRVQAVDLHHPLLSDASAAAARGGIKGIVVYDYGQGDCNAIVDKKGRPLVFFDMGGGTSTGSLTHPWHTAWGARKFARAKWRRKVPDVSREPTVLLSHWDADHYSTAWYLTKRGIDSKQVPAGAPDVVGLKWIAPRQWNKGPSTFAFAKELKKLSCWPAKAVHPYRISKKTLLRVERCTGSGNDANLNGIAVVLERLGKANEPAEQMLLPGDAPYAYIPSCQQRMLTKLVALLAFHHGSATHLRQARQYIPPPATKAPRVVYTYGVKPDGGRCYGHPSADAIRAYMRIGWSRAEHPGGAFRQWPPRADSRGDPQSRADVRLDFVTPDGTVRLPLPSASGGARFGIALRR